MSTVSGNIVLAAGTAPAVHDSPSDLENRNRGRIERSDKRVRAVFAGEVVADTVRPLLVWEVPYYPAYYLPRADVRTELIHPTGRIRTSSLRGEGSVGELRLGTHVAQDAVTEYPDSPIDVLRDHVRLDFASMDAWFEEDDEIHTHPRDPYVRIDVRTGSRPVRVEVDGVTIAESHSPRLLFETNLPTRYYLPKPHVRLDLLQPSAKVTHCPYKGEAEYWSVHTDEGLITDLAWSYRIPLAESERVAGLIAFPQERARVFVDGVLQGR